MTALVAIEAVAIVLLSVLVAGLLRSHADILRALHELGAHPDGAGVGITSPVAFGQRNGAGAVPAGSAADISGVTPDHDAVLVAVAGTTHDTLLAFLTSGCTTCIGFWEGFADPSLAVPAGARLVVVVHSPEEESLSRIRALAPAGVEVVMSSQAWDDYGVEVAPYFVFVSGPAGRVVGEGSASTWPQISSLVAQARADRGLEQERPAPAQHRRSTDRVREARADDELMAAGIGPGDPRLYPDRLDEPPTARP